MDLRTKRRPSIKRVTNLLGALSDDEVLRVLPDDAEHEGDDGRAKAGRAVTGHDTGDEGNDGSDDKDDGYVQPDDG